MISSHAPTISVMGSGVIFRGPAWRKMTPDPITKLRWDVRPRHSGVAIAIVVVIALATISAAAQSGDKYTARLGWVPTAGPNDRVNVTGKGTATAVLSGRKLSITGS